MKNITEILMCPECHSALKDDLKCCGCGKQYNYRHGVYNLISNDLSGNQTYLNRTFIPDDKEGMDRVFYDIWGREDLSDEELSKYYYSCCNQETIEALQKQKKSVINILHSLSGIVCDLATGGGTMLQ